MSSNRVRSMNGINTLHADSIIFSDNTTIKTGAGVLLAIEKSDTAISNSATALSNSASAISSSDTALVQSYTAMENSTYAVNVSDLASESATTANTTADTANTTANTANTNLNTLFTTDSLNRFRFSSVTKGGKLKMISEHSTETRIYMEPNDTNKPLRFYIVGDLAVTGTVTTSDDRIKNNEKLIENATETLMKLTPQTYDKYGNMDLTGNHNVESGLVTQEVYYNAPELRHLITLGLENDNDIIPDEMDLSELDIGEDPDYSSHGWSKTEHSSLNYNGLIPYLIKSNQELNERIKTLEALLLPVPVLSP